MNNEIINPQQRCIGLFIPSEVTDLDELTLFEERLLALIDSLYCKDHGGCFASNEYLAKKMKNAKVNTVVKALVNLRKLNLIEDVSFNGRKRVIKACIGKIIDRGQSQSACDLNHSLPVIKITPSIGFKSQAMDSSPIDEKKVYKKEERESARKADATSSKTSACSPLPSPSSKKPKEEKIAHGAHVVLKPGEYEDLCSKLGKPKVDQLIQAINDYVPNHKPYKDYAAAIRTWSRNEFSKNDFKTHSSSSNQTNQPKDGLSKIDENRAISERIRRIVQPLCNQKTRFYLEFSSAVVSCTIKQFFKDYNMGSYEPQEFLRKIIPDVITIFPQKRDELLKILRS